MVKEYKAKSLVPGHVIGKTGWYIAVPEKGYKGGEFKVVWQGEDKIYKWEESETFRVFKDKFRPNKMYTLGYFKWSEL